MQQIPVNSLSFKPSFSLKAYQMCKLLATEFRQLHFFSVIMENSRVRYTLHTILSFLNSFIAHSFQRNNVRLEEDEFNG